MQKAIDLGSVVDLKRCLRTCESLRTLMEMDEEELKQCGTDAKPLVPLRSRVSTSISVGQVCGE